jgi:hypothetical protein
MKRIIAIICIGMLVVPHAFAQQAAAVNQTPPAVVRPQRTLTPEQQAAADKLVAERKADYQNMLDQLHLTTPLRAKPVSAFGLPNSANYDESKANPYLIPDPLLLKNGKKVTTAKDWWSKRRPEIVEDLDREFYGRVPKNIPKVTWSVASVTNETVADIPVITKKLVGHVDNSSYPAISVDIDLTLTTPANATGPVPVMLILGPGSFNFGPPRTATSPPRPPGAKELVIQKGWGYASLNTGSVQADNGAGLTKGIIGLMNKGQFRKPDDWGALRAWAWGASRALDYFETDKAVNAKEVGVEGHSRWGKATIVTMAYDQRFAIAYSSSSGQGGAHINRRNAGETMEDIADFDAYHWYAGNVIKYSGPNLNPGDLPVDGHDIIALCAPRPVFIGGGKDGSYRKDNSSNDDAWADPVGMFMAAKAAGPVYVLLGKKDMGASTMPPIETMLNGDVAFRQHTGGHTDAPNWPFFITYANQYIK